MAYAYFTVPAPPLMPIQNGGEPAALYAWIFLLFAAFGPGPWALDRIFGVRRVQQTAAAADTAKSTVAVCKRVAGARQCARAMPGQRSPYG
jgi:putative oxidoreductase